MIDRLRVGEICWLFHGERDLLAYTMQLSVWWAIDHGAGRELQSELTAQ